MSYQGSQVLVHELNQYVLTRGKGEQLLSAYSVLSIVLTVYLLRVMQA